MKRALPSIISVVALGTSACSPRPKSSDAPSSPKAQAAPASQKLSTLNRVQKIVAKILKMPADRVQPSSTWKQLGADSLDSVEIVMALEEEFHIDIPDETAVAMKSVGDVISYVTQHGGR